MREFFQAIRDYQDEAAMTFIGLWLLIGTLGAAIGKWRNRK